MEMPVHGFQTVDSLDFRRGMSRLGAAVNIVTTKAEDGPYGFTASAVCSVSDTPAMLLACLNRASSCFPAFEKARYFGVNTLSPGHEALSNLFGGKTAMAERFAGGQWKEGRSGAPLLADALVHFECELVQSLDLGTHRVLFGRVIGLATGDCEEALFYVARRYATLSARQA